ncbi:MAG: DsbA family oxidoreductase [Alphaproteobacteria bacterium]
MGDRGRMRYTGRVNVDVFSDVICPWCFVGKRRLERALKMRPGLKTRVRWRPFQLNPDMPPEGSDREAYLVAKFGSAGQTRQVYEAVAEAGEAEGIGFAFDRIKRTPNTLNAHRLIRFAAEAGTQERVVELLFRRYFEEGGDVGDPDLLAETGAEAGLDAGAVRAHLASGDGIEAVRAEDALARRMGITGVPCFIVDGRYAIAGAHAPEVLLRLFDLGDRPAVAP